MKIEANLERIKQLGKEREDENWTFRSFLKGSTISDEELDALVQRINSDVTAQIDCTACANCCNQLWMALSKEDALTFASGLPMPFADFEEQYLTSSESGSTEYEIRDIPCPFLEENLCINYEGRPTECRSYPHLHRKDFRLRLITVIENYSICPIVFNVYERLKAELWQDRHARHRRPRI